MMRKYGMAQTKIIYINKLKHLFFQEKVNNSF